MSQNSMWARALAAFVVLLALGGCDPDARSGDAGGACICAAECERVIDTPGGAEECGGRNLKRPLIFQSSPKAPVNSGC